MILFDLLFELTAGAIFAAAERERIPEVESPPALPSFRAGLLYSAFFYVPAAVFFVRVWPDWSSHYLFDAAEHPWGAAAFAWADAVSLFAAYVIGYLVAAQRIRRRRLRPLLGALAAAWVLLAALLFGFLGDRSLAVTTTADFRRGGFPTLGLPWGDPRSLFGRPLMLALLVSGLWNVIPLALLYRRLRRRNA